MTKSISNMLEISPSSIKSFLDCPKCFYLNKVKKVPPIKGIMSSLPMGFDLLLKHYFDSYRIVNKIPPILEKIKDYSLYSNADDIKIFRSSRSKNCLQYCLNNYKGEDLHEGIVLKGAIDDLLVLKNVKELTVVPFDFKTRGFAPKEDYINFYRLQLTAYAKLLHARGFKTTDYGWLAVLYPCSVNDVDIKYDLLDTIDWDFPIITKVAFLKVNLDFLFLEKTMYDIYKCLSSKQVPLEHSSTCSLGIHLKFLKENNLV